MNKVTYLKIPVSTCYLGTKTWLLKEVVGVVQTDACPLKRTAIPSLSFL
jgi:hypothetical protein